MPTSASAPNTQSSRKAYDCSKLNPSTRLAGTTIEYVMQLPGSINMAPPPVTQRTTSILCLLAPSASISFFSDWNEPTTTTESGQSQNRKVGPRWPLATSATMTSSKATC